MKPVHLTVEKAYPDDAGEGIVRVDPSILDALGLEPDECIGIKGEQSTVARARRLDTEDWDDDIIRMDGFDRKNAAISLGERVTVGTVSLEAADRLVLSPTREIKLPIEQRLDSLVKRQVEGRAVAPNDLVAVPNQTEQTFMHTPGDVLPFVVTQLDPATAVEVTSETLIAVRQRPVTEDPRLEDGLTYDEIGGLEAELERVREMIELPLDYPQLFERLGIELPKGVLLHGPPGTGKTLLARAVANEADASFHAIAGPEIISKYYGESEQQLRETFEEARDEAPAIVFIDELDAIAPPREDVTGEVERRVVAQLLSTLDGLEERGEVIVIGATNRRDGVDEALRRPGRFDREIEIGVPDEADREEILRVHTRDMPLTKAVRPARIAANTQGFVGADLASLSREAAMHALRRHLPEIDLDGDDEDVPQSLIDDLVVTTPDFESVVDDIEPSALRETHMRTPSVSWDDVGGVDDVEQQLRESIVWPLDRPEQFERLGIEPVSGVLFYGPPGTGKTLLAKVVANETDTNFIPVRGPELLSKWVGESEKAIRDTFEKAREVAPAVVFFDELDSLAASRASDRQGASGDRVVNQLLTELDGLQPMEDVVVIGATNRPDMIDAALLRTGRFDRLIEVGAPEVDAREQILEVHTEATPLAADVRLRELADRTDGYVGSDLAGLAREAAIEAIRDDAAAVAMRHFERAIERQRPTLTGETREHYDRITEEFERGHWSIEGGESRSFQ